MTHTAVYKQFEKLFPNLAEDVVWFQNGKNSIRIRRMTGPDLMFSIESDKKWSLETVECYFDRLKGRTKM